MNRYVMIFAISPDFRLGLWLRKPDSHHNELFRARWTVPGGLIEAGECDTAAAVRELEEETGLYVDGRRLRRVLRFDCNCDPTEAEHEVVVYAAIVAERDLRNTIGSLDEPVMVAELPEPAMWNAGALWCLAIGRLKQRSSQS